MNALQAMRPEIQTPWMSGFENIEQDLEKHKRFSDLAHDLIAQAYPWLPALLVAANAKVLATPIALVIEAPAGSNVWFELPEITRSLRLLPWQDDGEPVQ